MAPLTLEIVEGPGAGHQVMVDRPMVIGRSADADFTLDDTQASRRHARVSPGSDGSLVIDDLDSANGTFVNQNEIHGPARLDPGDELLVGVTLLQVRSSAQINAQPSAVRVVPAALAVAPSEPVYVNPAVVAGQEAAAEPLSPELERYRDAKVRARAQFAPIAFLVLIAIVLAIYFATR
jgi:pSer/pThr/pTyr-binding forkhead associated (FHA) protein